MISEHQKRISKVMLIRHCGLWCNKKADEILVNIHAPSSKQMVELNREYVRESLLDAWRRGIKQGRQMQEKQIK